MKGTNFKYQKEVGTPSYLILCDGGNVRSAALATTLKLDYGREAIAVGRLFLRPETMILLSMWADRIVVTQPHMIESVPPAYHYKVQIADIGEDKYGVYINPDLNKIVDTMAENLIGTEYDSISR